MLKGIDPILNADVLHVLKSMGHGDDLIIADMNFPSDSIARQTVYGKLLKLENVTAGRAVEGVLSLMPLDSFVPHPALRMEIVGKPDEIPAVQLEVQAMGVERPAGEAVVGRELDALAADADVRDQRLRCQGCAPCGPRS